MRGRRVSANSQMGSGNNRANVLVGQAHIYFFPLYQALRNE